jgi:hypothetical protein
VSALIVAASASSLAEQIGSYAGIASVIGLGILALLYFSQAREVRRLREWAGREPERAAELAQRVQTDPQRRIVAQPLAPATPAARQQQQQATATAALYASVGATPPGVVAPAPAGQLARPAATPAAGLLPAPGAVPQPGVAGAVAPPASGGLGVAAAGAAAAGAAAAPSASGAPVVAPGSAATSTPAPAPASSPGPGAPAATAPSPLGQPAATTAAAQRSGSLSAYANGSTGQDTRESAAARPGPLSLDDDEGISGGRIALYVGGGLAVVLVAIVLMVVLTGGNGTQKPNDFGNTPAQDATPKSTSGAGAASGLTTAQRRATKVAVLNGTTQTGLARDVGDKIEKARFTLGSIGTNADQQIPTTIVAYKAGHQPAARAVAKIVGVPAGSVQPADANASAAADADVVVTVGLDQTG